MSAELTKVFSSVFREAERRVQFFSCAKLVKKIVITLFLFLWVTLDPLKLPGMENILLGQEL